MKVLILMSKHVLCGLGHGYKYHVSLIINISSQTLTINSTIIQNVLKMETSTSVGTAFKWFILYSQKRICITYDNIMVMKGFSERRSNSAPQAVLEITRESRMTTHY